VKGSASKMFVSEAAPALGRLDAKDQMTSRFFIPGRGGHIDKKKYVLAKKKNTSTDRYGITG